MKERVSATVEKQTIKDLKEIMNQGKYRNKSHVIEEAIKCLKERESQK